MMIKLFCRTAATFLLFNAIILEIRASETSEFQDRCEVPYFQILGEDSSLDTLPLKKTEVEVIISGVIADVVIKQTYENNGSKPLEAQYTFPASSNAAVYGMEMMIGERRVRAQIKEKKQAKITYDKAKSEGKTVSLLEQKRPNVFSMNVANLLPNDTIVVTLRYTEFLESENNNYRFVLPTVVGPRFSGEKSDQESAQENWLANPYLENANDPGNKFSLHLSLNSGIAIVESACLSHDVFIKYNTESEAELTLSEEEVFGNNRDFVFRYRLAGEEVESGLILHENPDGENFFLCTIQPKMVVKDQDIPKRDYIFIIDVSGSMHGFPLQTARELLNKLVCSLNSQDTFNLLFFAGESFILSETPLEASDVNLQKALRILDEIEGAGGTELINALRKVYSLPISEDVSRTAIIITDGYVSVEREVFSMIEDHLNTTNVFSFGAGSSVNRYLIEGIARAGGGLSFFALDPVSAKGVAVDFYEMIRQPMLTNIQVDFEGFDAYDVEPATQPDLFAKKPLVFFGKWRGAPEGSIRVQGIKGQGAFSKEINVGNIKTMNNPALPYLWARHRIKSLSDYNRSYSDQETKLAVTNLGLTYHLLTDFTSFVAVDEIVRNVDGLETVKQALPLPKGVSHRAIYVPTAPEPGMMTLGGVCVGFFLILVWRKKRLFQREARSEK